ncbi:MAG: HAD family hydrolase [Acidimicrobiales bacterium]|nr:HAD family hydrolase [Acidimicrobiales bacterium]
MTVRAVLFDKDGTIVDFHRTWDLAIGTALRATAPNEAVLRQAADVLEFDLVTDTVCPGSPLIAESNSSVAALVDSLLPVDLFFAAVTAASAGNAAPALGVPELFVALRERHISLGVVTNDFESSAKNQIATLGWSDHFAAVVGCDSGYGAKPAPGMVLGALDLIGVDAEEAVLVGDTTHDLDAGNGAGVTTVLVGNGKVIPSAYASLASLTIDRLNELIPSLTAAGHLP